MLSLELRLPQIMTGVFCVSLALLLLFVDIDITCKKGNIVVVVIVLRNKDLFIYTTDMNKD